MPAKTHADMSHLCMLLESHMLSPTGFEQHEYELVQMTMIIFGFCFPSGQKFHFKSAKSHEIVQLYSEAHQSFQTINRAHASGNVKSN